MDIDFFISSHGHTDHLDPGLIQVLHENCPDCFFIIPEAVRDMAIERGVPIGKFIGMDAGDTLFLKSFLKDNFLPPLP